MSPHRLVTVAVSYLKSPTSIVRNVSWRLNSGVSDEPVIFVVGAPRSGTTLLQRMLTVHDRLFSINGETGLFSVQNIFGRKHFGLSWSECRELFDMSSDVVNFLENGVAILRQKNKLPSDSRFVEKTPQHVLQLSTLMRCFPRADFIHIVRDGRDCYCSARQHPNVQQSISLRTFARYWGACVAEGMKFEDRPNLTSVRYEDLVTDPAGELSAIMQKLNLTLQKPQLAPDEIGRDARAERKEFARIRTPVRPVSVGRWKNELDLSEADAFEGFVGKQLSALGYLSAGQESEHPDVSAT